MDYACDGDVDCSDNSDEIDCDQIEFDEFYDKSVPRRKKSKNYYILSWQLFLSFLKTLEFFLIIRKIGFEYGCRH